MKRLGRRRETTKESRKSREWSKRKMKQVGVPEARWVKVAGRQWPAVSKAADRIRRRTRVWREFLNNCGAVGTGWTAV